MYSNYCDRTNTNKQTMPTFQSADVYIRKPSTGWSGFYLDCYLAGKVKDPSTGKNYKQFENFPSAVKEFYKLQEKNIKVGGIVQTSKGFDLRLDNIIRRPGHHLRHDALACWVWGPPIFCLKGKNALPHPINEHESWSDDWDWETDVKEKIDYIWDGHLGVAGELWHCRQFWVNNGRYEYADYGEEAMEWMKSEEIMEQWGESADVSIYRKIIDEYEKEKQTRVYIPIKDVKTQKVIGRIEENDLITDTGDSMIDKIEYF